MLFPSTLVGLVAATLALPAATAQESATDDTSPSATLDALRDPKLVNSDDR